MQELSLSLSGMICEHRAVTIESALNALPGVKAQVDYAGKLARVAAEPDVRVE